MVFFTKLFELVLLSTCQPKFCDDVTEIVRLPLFGNNQVIVSINSSIVWSFFSFFFFKLSLSLLLASLIFNDESIYRAYKFDILHVDGCWKDSLVMWSHSMNKLVWASFPL